MDRRMDGQMDRWTVNEYMKLEATHKLYVSRFWDGEIPSPHFVDII